MVEIEDGRLQLGAHDVRREEPLDRANERVLPARLGLVARDVEDVTEQDQRTPESGAEVVDTLQTTFSLNDPASGLGGTDNPADDAGKISGLAAVLLRDILTVDVSSPPASSAAASPPTT